MATRKNLIANGAEITPLTREELILAGKEVTPLNEKERTMTAAVSGGGGGGTTYKMVSVEITNNTGEAIEFYLPNFSSSAYNHYLSGHASLDINQKRTFDVPISSLGGTELRTEFVLPYGTYDVTTTGDIEYKFSVRIGWITGNGTITFSTGGQ